MAIAALGVTIGCQSGEEANPQASETNETRPEVLAARQAYRELLAENPCLRMHGESGSVYWQSVRFSECLEFLPPQRMRGVWVYGFEETSFIPGADEVPRSDNRVRFRVFLEVEPRSIEAALGRPLNLAQTHAVALEFVGRRSRYPGQYYTGEGDHVVVVDRLVSARWLGLAPEPDFMRRLKQSQPQ